MPGIVVVGLQSGDEGKGKVVDFLSQRTSHIVRSFGKKSADHAILTGDQKFIFHMIPSGILNPQAHCYIAAGCLLDPKALVEEIKRTEAHAVKIMSRLHISPYAKVQLPDLQLSMAQFIRPEVSGQKMEDYLSYAQLLRPFVCDVEGRIRAALLRDDTVLFEGESCATSAEICQGAMVGPTQIDEVVGVMRAYATSADDAPFPTAANPDEMEDFRRVKTTFKQKRVGWLDLVAVTENMAQSGVTNLILTKLDLLDHFEEVKLCVGYRLNNEEINKPPPLLEDRLSVEPIYEIFPGWQASVKEVKSIRQLPAKARAFVDRIEEFCNVPISMISKGPAREDSIVIDEEWM